MKKLLLILIGVFGIIACSQNKTVLSEPEILYGAFRGNPTYNEAENILFDACVKAKWQIVNKGKNVININFTHKGFSFDSIIRFSGTQYSIQFSKVNQDRGNLKETYAIYNKYVTKLNATIQKYSYKIR